MDRRESLIEWLEENSLSEFGEALQKTCGITRTADLDGIDGVQAAEYADAVGMKFAFRNRFIAAVISRGTSSSPPGSLRYHGNTLTFAASLRFDPRRLKIDRQPIGEGAFSVVHSATFQFSRSEQARPVALKVMRLGAMQNEDIRDIQQEIEIMHGVSAHANIANLIGVNGDPAAVDSQGTSIGVALMLELATHGSLRDLICAARGSWDWDERCKLLLDAARGIDALHTLQTRPIIHRDLKSMVNSPLVSSNCSLFDAHFTHTLIHYPSIPCRDVCYYRTF